jgi:NAD(P) transhydrogenase subunit alpha
MGMSLIIGVPREIEERETRVALVPGVAGKLTALGASVLIEAGAGLASSAEDPEYAAAGVEVAGSAAEVYAAADLVLKVAAPTPGEIGRLKAGSVLVGMLAPYRYPERVALLGDRGTTSFSLELLPRISRAQSMDVLSSQAAISGQKAALMAACALGRLLPMITTAVGTMRPARVVVLGAGVAGLQAIATSHRLGAVVEAYDVRRATREQVQSVGGRFIELPIDAESEGGYARELTDEERSLQQDALAEHIAAADAVITTAAVPGKPAPKLISASLVGRMKRGAVIIDLAAESGGNCELSRAGQQIVHDGVIIYAPLNVPAMLPQQASDTYARNLANFSALLIRDGALAPDWDDEIVAGTALTRDGSIVHEPARVAVERLRRARERRSRAAG